MRNDGLEEAQAGIKIVGRIINNHRYADDMGCCPKIFISAAHFSPYSLPLKGHLLRVAFLDFYLNEAPSPTSGPSLSLHYFFCSTLQSINVY